MSSLQPANNLALYPKYCFSISPTFGRWCPLRAVDIQALKEVRGFEGQDIYFSLNHPIKYVRLTGLIVAIDVFEPRSANAPGRWIATVDDSSGVCIEAVCAAPPTLPSIPTLDLDPNNPLPTTTTISESDATEPTKLLSPDGPNLTGLDVGSIVKLKGGITEFRGMRQIRLLAIYSLGDTNAEVSAWKEMLSFKNEVLSQSWIVTPEQEKQCLLDEEKRIAEEAEEERRAEKERCRRQLRDAKRKLDDEKRREEQEKREKDERRREKRRRKEEREGGVETRGESRKEKGKSRAGHGNGNAVKVPKLSRAVLLRAAGKYDALGI